MKSKTREEQILERVKNQVRKGFCGATFAMPVYGQKPITIKVADIIDFIYKKLIKQLKTLDNPSL